MRRLFLIIAAWCLLFGNAWAEHEIDHRYNIRGYILDKDNQGISNQDVRVFDGNNMLAESRTDSAGYYSLHLHLHNSDIGRKLRLRSGSNEAEVRASFDAADLSTLRVHEANFVGGEFVEGGLNRFRMPSWIYPLVGIVLLVFIAIKLEKRRKRKLREKHSAHGEQSPAGGHKKKKKKRK